MTILNREFQYDSTHHPEDEQLINYFAGKLPESGHESVQIHLVECDRCLDHAQDVRDFFESTRENEEMVAEDRLRAWSMLWERIESEKDDRPRKTFPAMRTRAFNSTAALSLAAMVLIILGLGFFAFRQWRTEKRLSSELEIARRQNAQLQADQDNLTARTRELEEENLALQKRANRTEQPRSPLDPKVSQPEMNAPIYDLYARNFTQRSGDQNEVNRIKLPANANSMVLILNGDGVAQSASYGVEIVGQNGKVIWRARGLKRGQMGNFTVTIGQSFLSKGTYHLKLFGESAQPLAEYLMRIE
jgi:hypothetical protein